jgi:hypothetical protein
MTKMQVNDSPKAEIKLIDFGLSAAFGREALTAGVGTMQVACWRVHLVYALLFLFVAHSY